MGITFDGQGSILKIKKPDPSRFNDISQAKDIIQSEVRDDLTEVIQSEAIQRLKTMRSLKKDQSDKHMLIDDEELMSSNYGQVPIMAEGALENKRGKNLIAKNETQVENTPNTVGNVQPNYGVRMKNNLKKEKFSKPNLHQEAKSQAVNPNTQSFDQVENTFRSKYSQMSQSQLAEMENWGKSLNGYTGGGNFDDDPNLKRFTLNKYNKMKQKGDLQKITKIEESKAYQQFLKDSNSQSQLLTGNPDNFYFDEVRQKSEMTNLDRKKKTAFKRR